MQQYHISLLGHKYVAKCCSYEFLDPSHLEDSYSTFYKLEIVNKDSSKTYSEIKNIKQGTRNNEIRIYPNPATGIANIECAVAKELLIIDYLGRTIKQFNNIT